MSSENWAFETKQIHVGQNVDGDTGARALPIYQTTSFVFDSAETAANRFGLSDLGPIYTRIGNPTAQAVEDRIAALEGGVGALLLASGQAATTFAILNVAQAGDHIVASSALYGGTYNLLKYTLKRLGVETTFIDNINDLDEWRGAIRDNTKLLFGETLSNPDQKVLDVRGLADIAHDAGVPLFVDNTVATPYLLRPIEHGADVVIHSATKYLGGHGTSIAGVLVDAGTFDYAADPAKFPQFNEPSESYHGLVFARDLGVGSPLGANLAFILKARVELLRPRRGRLPVQRVPHRARPRDVVAACGATRGEREEGRRVPEVAAAGRDVVLRLRPVEPLQGTRRPLPARRLRRRAVVRDRRWRRGGQEVRRRSRTALARREHR